MGFISSVKHHIAKNPGFEYIVMRKVYVFCTHVHLIEINEPSEGLSEVIPTQKKSEIPPLSHPLLSAETEVVQ